MLTRLLLLVLTTCRLSAGILSVCHDEMRPELQCYDLWPPYTNTNFHLPQSPSQQNITFRLFTVHNRDTPQVLSDDPKSLLESNWNAQHDSKVLVHGFTSSGDTDWMPAMVRELLRQGVNVIVVDWATGAQGPNYCQAAANTRVVGAQIASLILTAEELGASPSSFHVIGHSLGAQIGGYAGKRLNGRLGRVSGLDPAAPLFESYDNAVKLEKSDAMFVDVMHTDAQPLSEAGLGTVDLIGHVDFFPNGGKDMPGCPEDKFNWLDLLGGQITDLTDDIGCSHNRAPWYFIASINDNQFRSFPCGSTDGNCSQCGSGCTSMGYHATPDFSGLFVLNTGATYPF